MSMDPKMKILIVDDMSTMRKIVKNMLQKMGFSEFQEAPDGQPAWELIQQATERGQPFGLVVSDWNMPGMTGLDLLKNIRGNEKVKGTPFIMVTAEGDQANVIEAVKAGVNNFVVKPFSQQVFEEKIKKVFKIA